MADLGERGRGVHHLDDDAYDAYIEHMRKTEYPMLKNCLYLDHAGSTPCSKRHVERVSHSLLSNLYGNPHSASQPSLQTGDLIDRTRLKLLRMLNADPEHFDVVFTANATAAIKLVGDAFRDSPGGFRYAYHRWSHNSLVGLRELAQASMCFADELDAEHWLGQTDAETDTPLQLVAFPAQSNLDGERQPLEWCSQSRHSAKGAPTYVLLDAASLAATSRLDLKDVESAADFTVLSLYKIFGFPDLGVLIIKLSSSSVLERRSFFGGGTVDLVISGAARGSMGHVMKTGPLHNRLEDGTLPYHSIIALDTAIDVHEELYGGVERVARHTQYLCRKLRDEMSALRHLGGLSVVTLYGNTSSSKGAAERGPLVAFNLRDKQGRWIATSEFEKVAIVQNISVRTGGMCNPGGVAHHLDLSMDEQRASYDAGYRCGADEGFVGIKAVSMIRVSLGAMSTTSDVDRFIAFLKEFFIATCEDTTLHAQKGPASELEVESLAIYPIKSCGGWTIPAGQDWVVSASGLAWDRSLCIVNAVTRRVMNQKRYNSMALLRPRLDLARRVMVINGLEVPLDWPSSGIRGPNELDSKYSCGKADRLVYCDIPEVDALLSRHIGVPCHLARTIDARAGRMPVMSSSPNESPILVVSRASLEELNRVIQISHGKSALPTAFRANIVLRSKARGVPYAEDDWTMMRVGDGDYDFLGGCMRCQMVCIDQATGTKDAEPFATLAKTRRRDGKVMFGVHTTWRAGKDGKDGRIRVGMKAAVNSGKPLP